MKIYLILASAFFAFSISISAQEFGDDLRTDGGRTVSSNDSNALETIEQQTVVVIGKSAKVAWKITKFTAQEMVIPAANATLKPLVLQVAPKAAVYAAAQTERTAKFVAPRVAKLALKYVKYKFTP